MEMERVSQQAARGVTTGVVSRFETLSESNRYCIEDASPPKSIMYQATGHNPVAHSSGLVSALILSVWYVMLPSAVTSTLVQLDHIVPSHLAM